MSSTGPHLGAFLAGLLLAAAGCGSGPDGAGEPPQASATGAQAPGAAREILPPSAEPFSALSPHAVETDEGPVRTLVSYTRVYDIDRLYRSMQGPQSLYVVDLAPSFREPELLWVKGMSAEIVGEAGQPLDQEFMCHLVASVAAPKRPDVHEPRLATLSQGLFETRYPTGFGVPLLSSEPLLFNSQVMNQNRPDAKLRVRHRIETRFIRDRDLARPIQALTSGYAQVMVQLGGEPGQGYFGVPMPDEEVHGPSCAMGQNAAPDARSVDDAFGRSFSPHWVVGPGRVTNHSLATRQLRVGYDTTIHSIDVHLHPFAESVELRDLTTGETLFRSRASGAERGLGLAAVETYSSAEGIPVYADHEYGVTSVYDNPTGENQDAMAVLYVGLRDQDFDLGPLGGEDALRRRLESARRILEERRQPLRLAPPDPLAREASPTGAASQGAPS